jgi:hypothetical protein
MWEPRQHTSLWATSAPYTDSYTFFFYLSSSDCIAVNGIMSNLRLIGEHVERNRRILFKVPFRNLPEEPRKTMEILSHDSPRPDRDSNMAPS